MICGGQQVMRFDVVVSELGETSSYNCFYAKIEMNGRRMHDLSNRDGLCFQVLLRDVLQRGPPDIATAVEPFNKVRQFFVPIFESSMVFAKNDGAASFQIFDDV